MTDDHPHTDPGDGRTECDRCGKWVWLVTHSCKGVPVTEAARERHRKRAVAAGAPSLVSCARCGQPLRDDNCPDECDCVTAAVSARRRTAAHHTSTDEETS